MDESQMYTGKGEKAGWKATWGTIPITWHFRKGKTTEMIKKTTSGCWEFGQEGGEQNR